MPTAISQPSSGPVNAVPPGPGVLVPAPPSTLVDGVVVPPPPPMLGGDEVVVPPGGGEDCVPLGEGVSVGLGQSIRAVVPSAEA
jgi:hypothetical protein